MPLIKCPDCSGDVSTSAVACPGCGYRQQQASWSRNLGREGGLYLLIVYLGVVVAVVGLFGVEARIVAAGITTAVAGLLLLNIRSLR